MQTGDDQKSRWSSRLVVEELAEILVAMAGRRNYKGHRQNKTMAHTLNREKRRNYKYSKVRILIMEVNNNKIYTYIKLGYTFILQF